MSNPFRTRLSVEGLDARITPSDTGILDGPPAFRGLNVAVARLYPVDPTSPAPASPVFVLNYGTADATHAMAGLHIAAELYPVDPTVTASPVFFGLNGGGSVDAPG